MKPEYLKTYKLKDLFEENVGIFSGGTKLDQNGCTLYEFLLNGNKTRFCEESEIIELINGQWSTFSNKFISNDFDPYEGR